MNLGPVQEKIEKARTARELFETVVKELIGYQTSYRGLEVHYATNELLLRATMEERNRLSMLIDRIRTGIEAQKVENERLRNELRELQEK